MNNLLPQDALLTESACAFCTEATGTPSKNFAARYPEISSRQISRQGGAFAIPGIGQITRGHFLVVSTDHFPTWADAVRSNESAAADLLSVCQSAAHALGIDLARAIAFEHGAQHPSAGGCGIYHAHLHVVPITADLHWAQVFAPVLKSHQVTHSLASALVAVPAGKSYVLAGQITGAFGVLASDTSLPSQTMRRLMAQAVGEPNWDWRETVRHDRIESQLLSLVG